MSIETDQALIMLSVVARAFDTFVKDNAFARVDIKRSISWAIEECDVVGFKWPGFSNRKWSLERIEEFFNFIKALPDKIFKTHTLVYVCDTLLIDLMEKERGTEKEKWLTPIHEVTTKLVRFCNPTEVYIPAIDDSRVMVDKLYEIIKFKPYGYIKPKKKKKK